jgi:hypothetical protein
MKWQPLRLEELLRICAIAGLAVLAGLLVFLLPGFLRGAGDSTGSGIAMASIMVVGLLWWALPITVAAGLLLHLGFRWWRAPRLLLLVLFMVLAQALMTWCFPGFVRDGAAWWTYLHLWIAATSWLLYVAGPLRLWRFEFDPERHSDF